eukprot:7192231-Ditylum_brightwellii.AAC.1
MTEVSNFIILQLDSTLSATTKKSLMPSLARASRPPLRMNSMIMLDPSSIMPLTTLMPCLSLLATVMTSVAPEKGAVMQMMTM